MALDLAFGKRVYDWFGQHPRVYATIRWIACLGRERNLQELAIVAIGLRTGDIVLDLACGAGVNLAGLEARVGGAGKIIALDYSPGMLDTARARSREQGWTNIEFRLGDAACLELPVECLDGAICTFGLSAMPGELAALRRVAEALKPGTCLVVLDAKTFTGWARILNPVAGPLFQYSTNWNYKKDVVGCIRATFDEVQVAEYNSGCNFIAVARRK
jgi:ubiquinone/menaquinone biosynthesis C-methylase UbiE